jgi:hypothetical protein
VLEPQNQAPHLRLTHAGFLADRSIAECATSKVAAPCRRHGTVHLGREFVDVDFDNLVEQIAERSPSRSGTAARTRFGDGPRAARESRSGRLTRRDGTAAMRAS